jgi:hypothetical protein
MCPESVRKIHFSLSATTINRKVYLFLHFGFELEKPTLLEY